MKKYKTSNIIFIVIISIIVFFNMLVIFKAINFPNNWGYIIRWISLGVVFVISIIYWSLQFGTTKIIRHHKKQVVNEDNQQNTTNDDNQRSE